MSVMLSLLSLPFEASEAALILQMRPKQVALALASGHLKSSHELRELLPSRSKFMTGWDMLEYLIKRHMHRIGCEKAARLASCIVDEIATAFDDGSQTYRQMTRAEIADIASDVLAGEGCLRPTFSDIPSAPDISLPAAVAKSWEQLAVGLANLQAHMRSAT